VCCPAAAVFKDKQTKGQSEVTLAHGSFPEELSRRVYVPVRRLGEEELLKERRGRSR
jgi:hypothetical protein